MMKDFFTVDGNNLAAHIASPNSTTDVDVPGVVIAHGFPTEPGGGINSTTSLSALAEYVAAETGFAVMVFAARGMNGSEGDFSLDGWRRDLAGAVEQLAERVGCRRIWLIGFGTGGALAVLLARDNKRVRGAAAVAAPADFEDWARNPRKLLVWSREIGVIRDLTFPESFDSWASQLRTVKVSAAAGQLDGKTLLVLHGSEDKTVPVLDARSIASAHLESELHIIHGAGHHLQHDPRAVAILLGWLERQRNLTRTTG